MKILIIDDDSGDVDLLRESLGQSSKRSFDVDSESRLQDGIDRALANPYAAVILDLGLPDSKGLETIKRFRAACPNIPIVVLTGLQDEELAMDAVRFGAQEYVVKNEIGGVMLSRILGSAVERKVMEEKMKDHAKQLEVMNQAMTNRELKMIELKRENEQLKKQLGSE